ncbi:hypothetical protein [Haliangium ochraceum]|uniref:Uncharacterized protein n=1 Tax=Haliangium ochraceum (strain DSM 14365 / JCM 11303 / SMP-2) TaxID=502025 RepID=D0LIN6_HALO1|nr:hypothetical protein [Haliangium ochraceum]ACY18392.1 hypothetical protein Hoch_5917 [Haliangium ochraceum DSM 14365]
MLNQPMWRLRRLAPRAKQVLERRKQAAPALCAYEGFLVPAADHFIAAYDEAVRQRGIWRNERVRGRCAAAALSMSMRAWTPLTRDTPGVASVAHADDLFHAVECFLGSVERAARGEDPRPYQNVLLGELRDKLTAAREDRAEVEAADRVYQRALASACEAAEAFAAVLHSFCDCLAASVGRGDDDVLAMDAVRGGAYACDSLVSQSRALLANPGMSALWPGLSASGSV